MDTPLGTAWFDALLRGFSSDIILPMVSVTVELPDNIAKLLGEKESLPRSVLEAAAADGYRTEKLTRFQVGELLGLDRWQTEEFLTRHEAQRAFTLADYELERIPFPVEADSAEDEVLSTADRRNALADEF